MLGGGASVGVLAASGVIGGDPAGPTTIVQGASAASSSGDGADGRLDAEALYAGTSAGVVDIAAKGVASANAQPTPFGGSPQQPRSTATGTGFVIDSPC